VQSKDPPSGRSSAEISAPSDVYRGLASWRRAWAQVVLCAAAPGALAGALVAGLLFFLNPAIPFETGPVVRGALLYGGLLSAGSLLVHLPFTIGRPRRARRALPWSLTAVLGTVALVDWAHAAHFAYYLPPGINQRLLKAGLWLTLAALISFYTALLHSLHQRPYGVRTQVGYLFLALASVYVQIERREAFRPRLTATARTLQVEAAARPRMLVVGIEAATLDALLPLAEQDKLPFFRRLLYEGTYARLASVAPVRRTPLWTTLATGKYPYKHGMVGPQLYPAPFLAPGSVIRLLPRGLAFRTWGTVGLKSQPTDARAKQALALWEILDEAGVEVGVIGWPSTYPPPPGPRLVLTEGFFRQTGVADPEGEEEDHPPAARPAEVADRARLFRVAPEALETAELVPYGETPPREALANDLWRESFTLFLLEQPQAAENLFVLLPGLAAVSDAYYGGYASVQFEGATQPLYEEAARLVTAYYRQLDQFLARAWEALPEPRLLVVVSAHGVESPGGWRQAWGELSQRRSLEGRWDGAPDGVLLLAGEGVRAGSFLREARLVDLAPTLLYALGFPVARDLDGKVLTAAFEPGFLTRRPLTFVPSYERAR
jgi:hypothetical protein